MVVHDNARRYQPTPNGHYESWFVRANHPTDGRAVWLKATILHRLDGTAVAEAWCAVFKEGERPRALKTTVDFVDARFGTRDPTVEIGACRFDFGVASAGRSVGAGGCSGELAGDDTTLKWDLSWRPADGLLGQPLHLFPTRRMIDGFFPRNKLVTPAPVLLVAGTLVISDETIELDGWLGMQGHNWGREHAFAYAWGHVTFADAAGQPVCVAEGFSGRIKLAGRTTPHLSALVVRRGDRELRFDRLVDLWAQDAHVGDMAWRLRLRGRDGEASIEMRARPGEVVCLGYENPDKSMAYCLNSKLSSCELRVNPTGEDGFVCRTENLAALEILTRVADRRYPVAA